MKEGGRPRLKWWQWPLVIVGAVAIWFVPLLVALPFLWLLDKIPALEQVLTWAMGLLFVWGLVLALLILFRQPIERFYKRLDLKEWEDSPRGQAVLRALRSIRRTEKS